MTEKARTFLIYFKTLCLLCFFNLVDFITCICFTFFINGKSKLFSLIETEDVKLLTFHFFFALRPILNNYSYILKQ